VRATGSWLLPFVLGPAAALFGCTVLAPGAAPTGVHIAIVLPSGGADAVPVDEFRLRAQFREGAPLERLERLGRAAASEESVNIVFPDHHGGEEVQLLVDGTGGGESLASGRLVVTLKAGRYVEAALTLRRCAAATAPFCDGEVMVACDPATDATVRSTCPYGCDRTLGRCKECAFGSAECQGSSYVVCDLDGFDISRVDCAAFGDDCRVASCTPEGCSVVLNADGTPCDDGLYCTTGTACTAGSCTGGQPNLCDDANSCTQDVCDERNDQCGNMVLPDNTPCDDGSFCTAGDSCLLGVCLVGLNPKCVDANPCTIDTCNEATRACSFACAPAGPSCFNATQEVTCDAGCTPSSFKICSFGCSAVRHTCNDCAPSATSCVTDVGMVCNARVSCDASGQVASKTCCVSNRCNCAGTSCLEDVCDSSPDLSAGGSISGNTCAEADDIPGSCAQGGTACLAVAAGGAPDAKFRVTLDEGTSKSVFYNLTLMTASASLDTQLRLMSVCGVEASQVPNAPVCASPGGSVPELTCSEKSGAESMVICGAPEGQYFGAVDSAAGTCGPFDLSVSVTSATLDTPTSSGNITRGGTFRGTTCGQSDAGHFVRMADTGGICPLMPDCSGTLCPACNAQAATDCRVSDVESKCTYSGRNSPDAVFYLALNVDSGVDISTEGSDFDTVLYIMQSGKNAPTPTGQIAICNDDCLTTNAASHIQTSLPAGLYFVYVDGAGGACGNYVLRVVVSPAATCPNLACEPPFENCDNCATDCRCQKCGDGVVQANQGEVCDDGGVQGGDGCSATCNVEASYKCAGEPSVCIKHCGDGTLDTALGEECDDLGVLAGDGCDAACKVESGWVCRGEPSLCKHGLRLTRCPELTAVAGDPAGVDDIMTVVSPYAVGDVNVDVDIGDRWSEGLEVRLVAPNATTVLLHNHSAGNVASVGIQGNYDQTLLPAVPMTAFDGLLAAGTWHLKVVETWWMSNASLHCWTLNIETAGICGNGTCEGDLNETCAGCPGDCPCSTCPNGLIEATAGERCDDGGSAAGDGCSSKCQVEAGFKCQGQPSVCILHCGDGIIDRALGETCDDGGIANGDGCSAACLVEATYKCSGQPSVCIVHCGDGVIDTALGETCDDNNVANGDGCTSACLIDPLYKCAGAPSVCIVHCGDGVIDPGLGETCDDGNTANGDGCSSTCAVEPTYKCGGQPSVCILHCGDGVLDASLGEQCDDGGTLGGDGCDAACAIEGSFTCSGQPSVCISHCGDGVIDTTLRENCDDNNKAGGDGCSSVCRIEPGFYCTGTPSVCSAVVVLYNGDLDIESVAAGQYAKPAGWTELHSDVSNTAPTTPDVNWHISQKRQANGTRSWYYGSEAAALGGSYSNGVANNGTATSPNITIPATAYSAYILQVDVFAKTEGGATYDLYSIAIYIGGVSSQIFAKAQLGNGDTAGAFVRYFLPITASIANKSNVTLVLSFNTTDGALNTSDGVYIDGLQILGKP